MFFKACGADREMSYEEFVQTLMKQTMDKLRGQIVKFEQKRMNVRRNMDLFLGIILLIFYNSSRKNTNLKFKKI